VWFPIEKNLKIYLPIVILSLFIVILLDFLTEAEAKLPLDPPVDLLGAADDVYQELEIKKP